MKHYSVNYSKIINANRKEIWQVLAEHFGTIGDYSKGVLRSFYVSAQRKGIGTTRYCELPKAGFMREQVVIWKELEEFGFEILETSMPLSSGSALYFRLQALDFQRTKIKVEGTFRLQYLPFLSPLLKPKLRKTIEQMLVDIAAEIHKSQEKVSSCPN
ncbi:MAG: SRPBCC family protein [Bacteroidota bacterium]